MKPATRLKKAAEMADRIGLTNRELVSVSIHLFVGVIAQFHVDPKELIRIYYELKIPRSRVKAKEVENYVHITFVHASFLFVALVDKPEAAQFMAIAGQRRIEAQAPKPPLRRLTPAPRRLVFSEDQ